MVRLQLTELKAVLDFYERLTKKRLVYDAQAAAGGIAIPINVNGEVTKEEAIRIIETSLILNGVILVPAERSDIVKVIIGKSPRPAGIPIISDEALIPDGEQVITFMARLEYADPIELQQHLVNYQPPGLINGMTALPKSQAILITDNTAVIRGLLRIIRVVDVRPADVFSEFVVLERADAKDVLEKLVTIFQKDAATGPAGGAAPRGAQVPRPVTTTPDGTPLPPGATAVATAPDSVEIRGDALSEDSIVVGKIKLTADVRTNRIHVIARKKGLEFITKLIREFDTSVQFGEPVSRPLKFIFAGDILDVVAQSIADTGVKVEKVGEGGAGGNRQGAGGGAASGGGGSSLFGSNGGGNSTGGSAINTSEELQIDLVDAKPEARIVGTSKLIADKNANAIIVVGNADIRAKVFKLLDQLDRRIPQVMLHAVIGELNLNQREQFGVDYIIRSAGLGISPIVVNPGTGTTTTGGTTTGTGTGTTTTTTTTGTTVGQTSTNLVSVNGSNQPVLDINALLRQGVVKQIATAGGSGLTGFFTAGNSMTAIVTALENTGRFHVINRPSVFTRNNKKAIITSGQEIAVPTSTISSGASGNVNGNLSQQTQIQFKQVALKLEVVPLINSDKEVSLDILQSNNEVSGSTIIDNNAIPTIATRYVRTSVTVPNDATLVLGGLIKTSQSRARNGIPILSSIPLIGYLFSTTTKEKTRNELVILIRPVVTWAPPDAIKLREREMEFMNIQPDLESTIYPEVKKKKSAPEPMLRKSAAIPLRDKSASLK